MKQPKLKPLSRDDGPARRRGPARMEWMAWDDQPTDAELGAVSTDPKRFKRYQATAEEVRDYARDHKGRLPKFMDRLPDEAWADVSVTLQELDRLDWMRRAMRSRRVA